MSLGTYPARQVDFAPGIAALTVPGAGDWVEITTDVGSISSAWGRTDPLGQPGAGTADLVLDNSGGDYDPSFATGPYFGDLVPGTWFRIKGGTTTASTDWFYGHVSQDGFQIDVSQFPDQVVRVRIVDATEFLANSVASGSVYQLEVDVDAPVHQYRLGESSGTLAFDTGWSEVAEATYEGGATFNSRAGLIAKDANTAIGFDGVDDRVALPLTAGFASSAPFSIEAWISCGAAEGGTIYDQKGPAWTVDGERQAPFVATTGNNVIFGGVGAAFSTLTSSGVNVRDGQPHHIVCVRDATTIYIYIDGVLNVSQANTENTIVQDIGYIGSSANPAAPGWFTGTIDEVAMYVTALSSTRVLAHYNAGVSPWESDGTGARIVRVLDTVAWPSTLRNIDTGRSTMQAADLAGRDAAAVIAEAVLAERGEGYIDHQDGGKYRFRARDARWTASASTTSQATFGDGGGTEIPCESIEIVTDRIVNSVTVSRANGSTVTATDATSEAAFGRRTYTESGLLFEDERETRDRAELVVSEQKDARQRVSKIVLAPLAATHLAWAQVFARKVGDRITVKWRPTYGGTQTYTCYIDAIAHKWTPLGGLRTTFTLSPGPANGVEFFVWGGTGAQGWGARWAA